MRVVVISKAHQSCVRFEQPEGFLLKPDYKRAMQQRDSMVEPGSRLKDFIGRAGYNRRYVNLYVHAPRQASRSLNRKGSDASAAGEAISC